MNFLVHLRIFLVHLRIFPSSFRNFQWNFEINNEVQKLHYFQTFGKSCWILENLFYSDLKLKYGILCVYSVSDTTKSPFWMCLLGSANPVIISDISEIDLPKQRAQSSLAIGRTEDYRLSTTSHDSGFTSHEQIDHSRTNRNVKTHYSYSGLFTEFDKIIIFATLKPYK